MHGRRHVHAPGDRLEVVDVERVRIHVPVPARRRRAGDSRGHSAGSRRGRARRARSRPAARDRPVPPARGSHVARTARARAVGRSGCGTGLGSRAPRACGRSATAARRPPAGSGTWSRAGSRCSRARGKAACRTSSRARLTLGARRSARLPHHFDRRTAAPHPGGRSRSRHRRCTSRPGARTPGRHRRSPASCPAAGGRRPSGTHSSRCDRRERAQRVHLAGTLQVVEDRLVAGEPLVAHHLLGQQPAVSVDGRRAAWPGALPRCS